MVRITSYNVCYTKLLRTLYTTFEGLTYEFTEEIIPDQNWNKKWEENYFQPIIIGDKCVVRSPFHDKYEHIKHEIIIVITSYSIHYTKLYDTRAKTWENNGIHIFFTQIRKWKLIHPKFCIKGIISLHLAINHDVRIVFMEVINRRAHALWTALARGAKVRIRHPGHYRFDIKFLNFVYR